MTDLGTARSVATTAAGTVGTTARGAPGGAGARSAKSHGHGAAPSDEQGSSLFAPLVAGALHLHNRLVLAPLTRLRAGESGDPNDLLVEYYRQRASLGLIITEGTWPVREGRTWLGQPGIETPEQVAGWGRVADAVHAEGGTIAMQVMHGGRTGHPSFSGTGRIVSASATAQPGPARIAVGKVAAPVAHALEASEIRGVIREFVEASRRAIDAGMDAVELHGANGYLIHQFLSPVSNLRGDEWGRTPADRARFAIEVTRAVAEEVGPERTGIRLSPAHMIQGMDETDPVATTETYATYAEGVADVGLAFLDVLHRDPAGELTQELRRIVGAPLIVNTGFEWVTQLPEAEAIVGRGLADAVAVGRMAIANPDLAERWRDGLALNRPDGSTFYAGGAHGYTDYPTAR